MLNAYSAVCGARKIYLYEFLSRYIFMLKLYIIFIFFIYWEMVWESTGKGANLYFFHLWAGIGLDCVPIPGLSETSQKKKEKEKECVWGEEKCMREKERKKGMLVTLQVLKLKLWWQILVSCDLVFPSHCHVGTLAFRLNKPLTVRLFPCPGLKAGDMTQFTSPDLCNCTVFAV